MHAIVVAGDRAAIQSEDMRHRQLARSHVYLSLFPLSLSLSLSLFLFLSPSLPPSLSLSLSLFLLDKRGARAKEMN